MDIRSLNPARTGIEALAACAGSSSRRSETLIRIDQRTIEKYACKLLELWQLVLLHSWVDPDYLGYVGFKRLIQRQEFLSHLPWLSRLEGSKEAVLYRNALRAEKALRAGRIKPAFLAESIATLDFRTIVDLREFHAWLKRVRLPTAGPWPQRNEDESGWVPLRFPHSTQGLELMQRVAKLADAEAKEVWLTNRQTSDLAVKEGASRTQGDVIASLLRPDDLPRGRRPRH